MPHSQPLDTRLHDGAVAVSLGNRQVYSNPDADRSLPRGLVKGNKVTVFGEPAIGEGKRWWRIRKTGEVGFAWTVECDHDRYYLEPAGTPLDSDAGDPFPGSARKMNLTPTGTISTSNPSQASSGITLSNIRHSQATGKITLRVQFDGS